MPMGAPPAPPDVTDLMRQAVDPAPVDPVAYMRPSGFPPGPSARLQHADARAQIVAPPVEFDELTAPDEVTTAQRLRGNNDPIKIGRTAAILAQYGEGTLDGPTPEARLAATQLDWAKVAQLHKAGKIKDVLTKHGWDNLENLSDEEVGPVQEFVRKIGDMTDSVYAKDLDDVASVEVGLSGPMLHLSPAVSGRGDMAVPDRLPYIADGTDGSVVMPDGSVSVIGMPETRQSAVRHLEPLVTRPDGISLWASREPLRVMDATGWQRKIDSELVGHHVERWSSSAFGGRHPAQRPGRTMLVDVDSPGAKQKVGKLGRIIDPGEPAVVVTPDPEDFEQRDVTRSRRVAVAIPDDADLADIAATAKLYGAEPVAIYAPGVPPSGWAQATEQHLDDTVVSVVVRHNAGPPEAGEFGVFLPSAVVDNLPTQRPGHPTWTRSHGTVDYGVALCVDGILGKKSLAFATNADGVPVVSEGDQAKLSKGVYTVKGDPEDLLPAGRMVQLLRQLGQRAKIETEIAGKRIELS